MGLLARIKKFFSRSDDPILKADTIKKLAKAVNERFGTDLPLDPDPQSWTGEMWALKIKVVPGQGKLLYEATSESSALFGLGKGDNTPGVVKVFIEEKNVRFDVVQP